MSSKRELDSSIESNENEAEQEFEVLLAELRNEIFSDEIRAIVLHDHTYSKQSTEEESSIWVDLVENHICLF